MKDIYTSVSEKAVGHFLSGPLLIKFMANYEENVTGLCFEGDMPGGYFLGFWALSGVLHREGIAETVDMVIDQRLMFWTCAAWLSVKIIIQPNMSGLVCYCCFK